MTEPTDNMVLAKAKQLARRDGQPLRLWGPQENQPPEALKRDDDLRATYLNQALEMLRTTKFEPAGYARTPGNAPQKSHSRRARAGQDARAGLGQSVSALGPSTRSAPPVPQTRLQRDVAHHCACPVNRWIRTDSLPFSWRCFGPVGRKLTGVSCLGRALRVAPLAGVTADCPRLTATTIFGIGDALSGRYRHRGSG